MLVCLQRFPTALPTHVTDQFAKAALNVGLRARGFVYASNGLGDIPMAGLMHISLNPCRSTGWIPEALAKCFWRQLCPPAG